MTLSDYERLTDPIERILDETDEYCRHNRARVDGETVFKRIRSRRHGQSDGVRADSVSKTVPSFMKCHGILDHGAAEELRAAQADFSKVEPELWR